jgi:hypothetical protein
VKVGWVALLVVASAVAKDGPGKYFDKRVAPILIRRCLPCHNRELNNRGLSFQDPATVGAVVVPGQPDKSLLIETLRHEGQLQMPPGPALPGREVKVLREWVRRGAVWGSAIQ